MCDPKAVLRPSKKAAAEVAAAAAAKQPAGAEAAGGEGLEEVDMGERFDGPEPVYPALFQHHVHHAVVWSLVAALMIYDGFFWSLPLSAFMLWYGDAYTAVLHCALDRPKCLNIKILTVGMGRVSGVPTSSFISTTTFRPRIAQAAVYVCLFHHHHHHHWKETTSVPPPLP
jgi:hypothetical protein